MLTQAAVVSVTWTRLDLNRSGDRKVKRILFCLGLERQTFYRGLEKTEKEKNTKLPSGRQTPPQLSPLESLKSLCINWSPSPSNPLFCTLYCVRFFLSPSCYGYKSYWRLEMTRAETKEHYLNCRLRMQPRLFVNKMQCLQISEIKMYCS